jgi:hypothetical protein
LTYGSYNLLVTHSIFSSESRQVRYNSIENNASIISVDAAEQGDRIAQRQLWEFDRALTRIDSTMARWTPH